MSIKPSLFNDYNHLCGFVGTQNDAAEENKVLFTVLSALTNLIHTFQQRGSLIWLSKSKYPDCDELKLTCCVVSVYRPLLSDSFMSETKRHFQPHIRSDCSGPLPNLINRSRDSGLGYLRCHPAVAAEERVGLNNNVDKYACGRYWGVSQIS